MEPARPHSSRGLNLPKQTNSDWVYFQQFRLDTVVSEGQRWGDDGVSEWFEGGGQGYF